MLGGNWTLALSLLISFFFAISLYILIRTKWMSKSVQSNDTLLYISSVGIYIYTLQISREEKKRRRERSKNEGERESKTVQSLSHGWLPCESEKNNNNSEFKLKKWTTIITSTSSNISPCLNEVCLKVIFRHMFSFIDKEVSYFSFSSVHL
jgi:multisubunit Na+/H+ antiporter MnhC subunit